jgi:peptide/nickel transport system substrate-binding protein
MSTRPTRTRHVVLAIAAATAAAFATAAAQAPREGTRDTLVVGVRYPVGPLDPAVTLGVEQTIILPPVYETLVKAEYDAATGRQRYVPGLARSWFVSADGRQWTFHLERNHRFSDGAAVTAEAVRFTLERAVALKRGPSSALREFLDRVEVIDPHTLRLYLRAPSQLVLPTLADRVGYIVNPAVAARAVGGDHGSAWLAERTAGSGPYHLVRYRPRDHHVLAANPHYHGDPGSIRRVIYREVRDPSIRGLMLERGEIDIALFLLVESLPRFRTDPRFVVQSSPAMVFKNLALNVERGVFSQPDARRAVAHAIDYDAFVRVVLSGQARRFRGPLPPGLPGATATQFPYEYDPGRARALLARTRGALDRPIDFVYGAVSPLAETAATFLKSSLEAVGLRVRLQALSIPALLDRVDRGNYDAVYMGWVSSFADPAAILNFWFDSSRIGSAGNYARYRDPRVDALLADSLAELDRGARERLVSEVVALVSEDVPYVYLSQDNVWTVAGAHVRGYVLNPLNLGDFGLLGLTVDASADAATRGSTRD